MNDSNVYKDFDEITRRVSESLKAWENGKMSPGVAETYSDIWRNMNYYRDFMANERKDNENKFTNLSKIYAPSVVTKHHTKFADEIGKVEAVAIQAFRTMIADFTETQHKKVTKMVRTAPSDSMLNLLETLKMRDDLDAAELYDIMPLFYENYHALRALQAISRKNGITLHAPIQMDSAVMHKTIDSAAEYLNGACTVMFAPKTTTTRYNDFFTVDPKHKDTVLSPVYQRYIDTLDYVPQLQDFSAEKKGLTTLEKIKIDWYFHDLPKNADETQIAMHTKKVMDKHPDDIELLKMSQYSKYVEIVEEAAKTKND